MEITPIRSNIGVDHPSHPIHYEIMKTTFLKFAAIALIPALSVSCMTTYDAYGNPVQSVDPGAATAIAVGAAALGVAAGRQYRGRDVYYYHGRPAYYHGGRRYYVPRGRW